MTNRRTDVDRLLESQSEKPSRSYMIGVQDIFVGVVTKDPDRVEDGQRQLGEAMRETMGRAEILGASRILKSAAGIRVAANMSAYADRPELRKFAAEEPAVLIPSLTFQEALEDMVQRTPVTVRNAAERTALRIAQIYAEGNNAAFVRAPTEAVTTQARNWIARAIATGQSENEVARQLRNRINDLLDETQEWSQAYSRMVYRTNLNTATTAGRFRQVQDDTIREVIPAMQFDAVGDSDTRDNHRAADGVLLKPDNPAWAYLAAPLGYNCRCQVNHLSIIQLDAMGRLGRGRTVRESVVPQGAGPDPNFRQGGRPDLFLSGRGLR